MILAPHGVTRSYTAHDDAYSQLRGSYPIFGVEIRFDLFRRMRLSRPAPFEEVHYGVTTSLDICGDREYAAFREIHRDWRGLLKKFLEPTPLTFFQSEVIPAVDKVKSKQPLPKIDALMGVVEQELPSFDLEFSWGEHDLETCLNALLVQAILFTCVQKAAIAPRSKREHLLEFWQALNPTSSAATS